MNFFWSKEGCEEDKEKRMDILDVRQNGICTFRKVSVTAPVCDKQIYGKGWRGISRPSTLFIRGFNILQPAAGRLIPNPMENIK